MTREPNQTIVARVQRDQAFAKALLDEAATMILNGEQEPARLILRDQVNATIGFEALATKTRKPAKSLQRMLSARGNPGMNSLSAIFSAVQKKIGTTAQVHFGYGNAPEPVIAGTTRKKNPTSRLGLSP